VANARASCGAYQIKVIVARSAKRPDAKVAEQLAVAVREELAGSMEMQSTSR